MASPRKSGGVSKRKHAAQSESKMAQPSLKALWGLGSDSKTPALPEATSLLQEPTAAPKAKSDAAMDVTKRYKRAESSMTKGERFTVSAKSFDKQYASIYYSRLHTLKPVVLERAKQKWFSAPDAKESVVLCERVSEARGSAGKLRDQVLIGTVYKDMKKKPSILDEYENAVVEDMSDDDGETGGGAVPNPLRRQVTKVDVSELSRASYLGSDDYLVLEDDSGRVRLGAPSGAFDVDTIVSGVVVAVRGREGAGGVFEVNDIVYPGVAPLKAPLPVREQDSYVLLLSGLYFGHPDRSASAQQLLLDYVTGFLGNGTDQQFVSGISRVIIAGNSLYEKQENEYTAKFKRRQDTSSRLVEPLEELDMFLTQLAASTHVDILPGFADPSNFSLPQQPLHRVMFPSARTYSTLQLHTNPAELSVDGVHFMGTGGQNTDNMLQYSRLPRDCDALKSMLEWRNVAPTAPDTLACYPFQDEDPFVLKNSPHVMFSGNALKFDSQMVTDDVSNASVRAVMVPSFLHTQTAVLLNLRDLSCNAIEFSPPGTLPLGDAAATGAAASAKPASH